MCLAIPGRVVKILDAAAQLAQVDVGGVRRTVNIGLLAGAGAETEALSGQWVLIHVGFALSRIDEQEAMATLELLHEMGEIYEQELRELKGSAIE